MVKVKSNLKNIFSLMIAVFMILTSAYIFKKNYHLIASNLRTNVLYFILIMLAYIAGRIIDGVRLKVMASAFGLKLTRKEWVGLAFVVPYYNLLLPKGGTVANAAYFNFKHNFKFEKFASLSSGGLIMTLLVNSFFGILSVFFYALMHHEPVNLWFLMIFIPFLVVALILLFVKPIKLLKKNKILAKINDFLDGWKKLSCCKDILFKLLFLQVCLLITFALRYYCSFFLLGIHVSYLNVLALSSVTYISNLIGITPGNLGLRELVVSFTTKLIGQSIKIGALVSIIDRSTITIITCIFGFYYHLHLMKSLDEIKKEKIAEKVVLKND